MHASDDHTVTAKHPTLGKYNLYCMPSPLPVSADGEPVTPNQEDGDVVEPQLLFTENNTNFHRLYGGQNETPFVKDAFHDHIISAHRPPTADTKHPGFFHSKIHSWTPPHGTRTNGNGSTPSSEEEYGPRTPFPTGPSFVNPERKGTKSAAHYVFRNVPPRGGCAVVRLKLTPKTPAEDPSLEDEGIFDETVEERRVETTEFYDALVTGPITDDLKQIMRQALGGMLWTKQFYQFIQKDWLSGDPAQPPPPPERKYVRNRVSVRHYVFEASDPNLLLGLEAHVCCRYSIYARQVSRDLPLPLWYSCLCSRWEYPFFAAWDTAFHCIPLAIVDPAFAKKQLDLLTREWYMKPDGQIPAYEWNFGDVNPPVHAW